MSESTEQQDLVYWFRTQYPDKIIFAIPNGSWLGGIKGKRAMAYGALRKREGLTPGVSDLFIPEPAGLVELIDEHGNHYDDAFKQMGLFLEMKNVGETQCAVRPEQKWFLDEMRRRGYAAEWAAGFDQGQAIIKNYMEGVV